MSSAKSENIKVVVRCRPLSQKELDKGYKPIVNIIPSSGQVQLLKKPDDPDPKCFQFNSAYPWDVTQQFIYDDGARPIIDSVLEGYNGTIFAYGQTGTGKTYTMEGIIDSEEHKGIILHAFDHIFAHISKEKSKEFLVRASFLQIYMEDVYDLLGDPKKKLHVRQLDDDVSVVGLSTHIVKSPEETIKLLVRGKENRATGATAMNQQSSRSHSVFTIVVEQHSEESGVRMGKLHLVDLAGSERLGKTEATGERAKEGAKINQSLLELGNVISALVTGKKHVSYRNSKLTQLLQDSLGGNSKTMMIATLGPASYNYEETHSTLLYATRARDIKNAPRINEDPKDALLGQLRQRILELKKQLEAQQAAAGGAIVVGDNKELKEIEERHQKQLADLMASKSVNEEEREKARQALEAEYERQKSLRAETQTLQERIKAMEKSVLIGGENLVDKAKQQEEELRAQQSRILQQQEEQRRLDEKKKQQEEQIILVEKKYSSLQQELDEKSKNIKKLKPLIKQLEESIDDIQQQFEREKEEQSEHIIQKNKDLKLLQLIAESFIPADKIPLITRRIEFDSSEHKMKLPYPELAGRHIAIKEEVEEEQIFISGIDEPMNILNLTVPVGPTREEKEKARQKRKTAVNHALAEMALSANFIVKTKE